MMSWLVCLVFLAAPPSEPARVDGHVVDSAGRPIADALVFAENVAAGELLTTRSDERGAYAFNAVMPGLTGVFAHAPGHAFGGYTAALAPGESLRNQPITLGAPASVSGKVSGYKAKAVGGALILRVALLGERKVSIPFDRLEPFGFRIPVSDDKGRFEVENLPDGVPVALKFSHATYPVQAVSGLTAGERNAKAILMPGVTVTGNTLLRGEDKAVAHVQLTITNAQPPYETVSARSDGTGRFHVSLKPGMYTFEGFADAYRSAGMQRVAVTGETLDQRVNVFMMPTGVVVGAVRDAKTEAPVAGAKLILESGGNPAGVAYTDAKGYYRFTGASGVNKVYLAESPGYQPGETRSMEVTVPGGGEYEMPVFWVMPQEALSIKVIDAYGGAVSNAIVTLLSPPTLGWRIADAAGNVALSVAEIPEGGRIAGISEHPSGATAGLFAIGGADSDRVVQLFPVGQVRGRVTRSGGGGAGGVIVAGRLVDEAGRPSLVLWQTISHADGSFTWPGVVPYVHQRVYAYVNGEELPVGASFSVEPGSEAIVSPAVVPGSGASVVNGALEWAAFPHISGVTPTGATHPAVLFFAPAAEGAVVLDALEHAEPILKSFGYHVALVLDGPHAPFESRLPVLQGTAPGPATTYITTSAGQVAVQTFGLPPLSVLAR